MINQFNQVIAFSGRLLEKSDFAKYKNTSETPVFSKSNTLFNINNLKKLKNEKGLDSVIIVEGHLDVVSLVQAGFPNVVASMGTSLTKDQARILKRYTDKVFISYDGDFAGQKAAIRGLEILSEEGLEVKVVALPDGLDPDDVVKKFGYDGYKELLLSAKPLIDFKIDILKKTFDLNTVDGKRKFVSNAIKVIRESGSAAEQEDLLKIVRDYTGVTYEALKRELYSEEPTKKTAPPPPEFTDNVGDRVAVASRVILSAYLFSKPYALETDIEKIEFLMPVHKEIQKYIVGKQKDGEKIKFNDLYEVVGESDQAEVSRIAGMETDENKKFDQNRYFFDCLNTVSKEAINKKIERLTALFSAETDTEKRREFALEMTNLIKERSKIM
jgi:DNA primase